MKLSRRKGSADAVILPSRCLVLVSEPPLSLGTLQRRFISYFQQTIGHLRSGCEGLVWKLEACGEKEM